MDTARCSCPDAHCDLIRESSTASQPGWRRSPKPIARRRWRPVRSSSKPSPTTFGFKAAGWLVAVLDARRNGSCRCEPSGWRRSSAVRRDAGGPRGAGRGGARPLRLGARAGGARAAVAHEPDANRRARRERSTCVPPVLAKVGLDLVLLAQTEVGEVRERTDGGSSTMPQKRNPVHSVLARACAELVSGYASVLSRSVVQEHERAAGAWQAEWDALSGALAYAGGAASNIAEAVDGLEVDTERMRRNLELTGGLIVAERLSIAVGGGTAHDVVREAAHRTGRVRANVRRRAARRRACRAVRRCSRRGTGSDDVPRLGRRRSSTVRSSGTGRRERET